MPQVPAPAPETKTFTHELPAEAAPPADASTTDQRGPGHFGYGPEHWRRQVTERRDGATDRADDAHIRSLVRAALGALGDGDGVEVAVTDGEVTLSGLVADEGAMERAQRVASNVKDVRAVKSQLRIR